MRSRNHDNRRQVARALAESIGIDLAADLDNEQQQRQQQALRRSLTDRLGSDEARQHLGDDDGFASQKNSPAR